MDKILLLLDRPNEPLSIPKGDEQVVFDLNSGTKRISGSFGSAPTEEINNFSPTASGRSVVQVSSVNFPEIADILNFPRDAEFSTFLPLHRKHASTLISIFMKGTVEDFFKAAANIRDQVNPELFNYAVSIALIHRNDTRGSTIPLLSEVFPDKFIGSKILKKAREETVLSKPGFRFTLDIPYNFTASDEDPEHRLAYWREDIGINLHHWHWHLVYPFDGPEDVVRKDRRGELFYYMHQQIMARYNTERFCNGLDFTKPLDINDFDKPILEGYFPKLDMTIAGRNWPARPANMRLYDVNRKVDGVNFSLSDLKTYRDRIYSAINTLKVQTKDKGEVILDEKTGIDILGNMIEASSILSPNSEYYGNLHNFGHIVIASCHDPDLRHLEPYSVMGSSTTAMRDPIFYRWHAFINNIFQMYKRKLNPYSREQLTFDKGINIQVLKASIVSPQSNPNTVNTYWTKSRVNLSYGLDFAPRGAILVSTQHLNHDKFEYKISVKNNSGKKVTGTVRIFIAPRHKQNGNLLTFEEKRHLMIEMDKFTHSIPPGESEIRRQSSESSVTIPREAIYRQQKVVDSNSTNTTRLNENFFCGCGWPEYMLVPKGAPQNGIGMDLFVMITDYNKDKVEETNIVNDESSCKTGISFCGLQNRKYPDARPMGFPFDRPAKVVTLDAFLTPNMTVQPITIRFTNTIKQ